LAQENIRQYPTIQQFLKLAAGNLGIQISLKIFSRKSLRNVLKPDWWTVH